LLSALFAVQYPVGAEVNVDTSSSYSKTGEVAVITDRSEKKEQIIAQASPSSTASQISGVAVAGVIAGKKQKNELLITDSLWGNLILDLAYQRDRQLKKLAKRLNLVNLGTTAAVTGIAGGTLAQAIISLSVLNPPPPLSDSYLPGAVGVGFAGLTIVTFAGRTVLNHVLVKRVRNRQLEIKRTVEAILAQMEATHGESTEAQNALISLIGERATNEWLQLWRSSNTLAQARQPKISLTPSPVVVGHHM
jgi:hypothetical protein